MEFNIYVKIEDLFKELSAKIDSLAESKKEQPEPTSSTEIKDLAAALSKAQSEMNSAKKTKENPYFKSSYADLESVVSSSRPALTKNGLSVVQQIIDENSGSWLITTLLHTSGQWIKSKKRIVPQKTDIQSVSSHTTYLKRMCYASLIGVVAGENDDDGEADVATSRETFAKGTALNTKYNPKHNSSEVITSEQLEELEYELEEYPDICELVLEGLKIQNLADMPKEKFLGAITRIREIKLKRNGK